MGGVVVGKRGKWGECGVVGSAKKPAAAAAAAAAVVARCWLQEALPGTSYPQGLLPPPFCQAQRVQALQRAQQAATTANGAVARRSAMPVAAATT